MKAASPERLLTLLGIQISPGTSQAAGEALEATFPSLEALLGTSLLEGTRTDIFSLGIYQKRPTVRLTFGFLKASPAVSVTASGTTLDSSAYRVDAPIGVIRLVADIATGDEALSVAYSYGFAEDANYPGVLGGLPEPVISAGLSLASAYFFLNASNAPKQKAATLSRLSVKGYEAAASRAVECFSRPRATVLWPDAIV